MACLSQVQIENIEVTPAEFRVVNLLVQGESRMEISSRLFISMKTIECHVFAVCKRNQIKNEILLSAMIARGWKFKIKANTQHCNAARNRLFAYLLYKYGGCNLREISRILRKDFQTIKKYLAPYF
jgi:DNA-binding NarL/FixJ family response regulator